MWNHFSHFHNAPSIHHTGQDHTSLHRWDQPVSVDSPASIPNASKPFSHPAFVAITILKSRHPSLLLERVNQSIGAGIVFCRGTRSIEIRLDILRQRLPELHTPLIERIDVPDRTLSKHHMLVVRNQRSQRTGRDLLRENARRRPITKEDLMRHQIIRRTFFADLIRRLTDHERLGLRKIVGREHLLVLVVLNWVVGFGGEDEVGGDELGTLVQELEEGVLGVGAGLAEDDCAGGVFHVVAGSGDSLSIGLHEQLLEVGGEAVHVLVESVEKMLTESNEVGRESTYGAMR